MSRLVRYQFWIILAAGVIYFANLGVAALFDMDEALYTTCAREMHDRHNLVVPWFNGEIFPEKPVLMFWTMIGGFELFGVSEFGARFFSAMFGVGTALLAFHLGRILFNPRVGFWTGLITASTIVFAISARAATVDSALTFFTTLAFLMFVLGWQKGSGVRGQGSGEGEAFANRRFPLGYAIATYACIGVAVLGKGPVGMLLPVAAMGLFLLGINGWRSFFRSAWWMRPITLVVVIAVVAAPWYIEVGRQTNWEWPKQFFWMFNVRPFSQPIQGHGSTSAVLVSILLYFFQIAALLICFFPWSVFLGPTVADTFRRLKEGKRAEPDSEAAQWRPGVLLAACWFLTWLVFWSICKTKLPHYLMPAYPALAMLTACFVDRWLGAEALNGPLPFPTWALRNAWISMIVVGLGIMIAIPIVVMATNFLPGEGWLGCMGLPLVLGGGWCWWTTSRGEYQAAAIAFAVASVVFLTAAFGIGTVRVDRFQNAKPMIAAICADEGVKGPELSTARPRSPIATYCFFRESTVYYNGKPVTKCDDDEATGRTAKQALAAFVARPGRSYVITTNEYEPEIKKAFADKLKVIHREPRFLADGEMVIFRRGE